MAVLSPIKRALTIPPTLYSSHTGVPISRFVDFNVRAQQDDHHHHNHSLVKRSGIPMASAGSISLSSRGLVCKSYTTVSPSISMQRRLIHTTIVASDASNVPDFKSYQASSESYNRAISYFMVGSMGVVAASGAKSTITEFLGTLSASADVLALAKVEVELASIPEGRNVIIKWRGKPVFVRHRTQGEIEDARKVDWKRLRDPESDENRTKKPEWLVMLGVCTHLGCVPIGESGDFGGWFCPCHGSHYDISGRTRKGPAPLNLEIPEYSFKDDLLVIG